MPYAEDMTESRPEPDASATSEALGVFVVDPGSPAPPFRQLHDSVVHGIAEGRLLPGQKLPTIRALAAHFGLAVNTVAAAYRALESSGVIEGRGRSGTFVSLGDDPIGAAARKIALDAAAQLRELGIDSDRARGLLSEAVDAAR